MRAHQSLRETTVPIVPIVPTPGMIRESSTLVSSPYRPRIVPGASVGTVGGRLVWRYRPRERSVISTMGTMGTMGTILCRRIPRGGVGGAA